MIKRVTIDYMDRVIPDSSRDYYVACKLQVDPRLLNTEQARREFASVVDEAVAMAVTRWEFGRA